MAKIVFKHENGKFLVDTQHEDGGNCFLTDDVNEASLFNKDFNALDELLEQSDDYEEGNPEWDHTKFTAIDANIILK